MATKAIELKVNYNDEVNDGNIGTFVVQPLERGYGTTARILFFDWC
jgi:DNA-directed RNA polymerase alpha subunit